LPTLISHQKQFVFIHINKTGGTSMTSLLGRYEEWPVAKRLFRALERRYLKRKYKAFSCCGQQFVGNHASAAMVRKVLGDQLYRAYFKFALVRNPWDREVSRYFYARNTPTHAQHQLASRFEFAEFIKQRSRKATRRDVSSYQYKKVSDNEGNLIVDAIVRIENLAEEIVPVFARIGIDQAMPVPRLNRSGHRRYQDYYDDESIELVRQFAREDIERFGYRFEYDPA